MSSLFGLSTVTDELLPERSRDQQLGPAAVPRATWHWWQPLQQQQPSWEPVCLPYPGHPMLEVGTGLTLKREGEKRKRFLRQDKLWGACGRKWGNLVTSAGVTNVSCLSSVLIAAQHQDNNSNSQMNKMAVCRLTSPGSSSVKSECFRHSFTKSKLRNKR